MISCVDRISFDTGDAPVFPLVVEGYISDEEGPYKVEVSRGFDLQSQAAIREPLSVSRIELSDNAGNVEVLTEVKKGEYYTRPQGIKGVVGRAYKLKVELADGRIYETIPDTMKPAGSVGAISQEIVKTINPDGVPAYAFDIFFDSDAEENDDFQFLWKMVITYEISTTPDLTLPEPLPCSGRFGRNPTFYIFPCECCFCWIQINSEIPVLSDGELVQNGIFRNVRVGRLPINGLTLQYKAHVEVQQYSVSYAAYNFWKAIRDQKSAITSLFQPLSGKIKGNFVQVKGDESPVVGIFYASAVSRNSKYISVNDVPDVALMLPPLRTIYVGACTDYAGATNRKPDFWE